MKYAVFSSGGKQYLTAEGDRVKIEKIDVEKGKPVEFDKVLLSVDEKKVEFGKPYLKTKIKGVVEDHSRAKKITVFKYKAKTGYHKTRGHKQHVTEVKISKV